MSGLIKVEKVVALMKGSLEQNVGNRITDELGTGILNVLIARMNMELEPVVEEVKKEIPNV